MTELVPPKMTSTSSKEVSYWLSSLGYLANCTLPSTVQNSLLINFQWRHGPQILNLIRKDTEVVVVEDPRCKKRAQNM